jgi:hypothetical protein
MLLLLIDGMLFLFHTVLFHFMTPVVNEKLERYSQKNVYILHRHTCQSNLKKKSEYTKCLKANIV